MSGTTLGEIYEKMRLARIAAEASVEQKASSRQVGGDHYATLPVQPWDAMAAWMSCITPGAGKASTAVL